MTSTIPDEIRREVMLPASIERAWNAITEPAEVNKWFGDRCVYELREGATGVMQWGEHAFRMVVVTVDPPRRFAYRWVTPRDDNHAIPFEEMPTTLVEFTLESVAGGTRLTLVESGFASHPEKERDSNYADNSQGWTDELAELQAWLNAEGL
ncbi:MAG: SRPBCC family protein [Thermomicrobiales bacterium]